MSTDLESEEFGNDVPEKANSDIASTKSLPQEEAEEVASSNTATFIQVPKELIENEEDMDTDDEDAISNVVVKIEKEEGGEKDLIVEGEDGDVLCKTMEPKNGLAMNVAMTMLMDYKEFLSTVVKDWHPKEGEVYVFDLRKIGRKWKADGYEWRNNGSTVQPKRNPTLKKVFYIVRSEANYNGDRAFQKVVYSLIDQPKVILVHYLGDSSISMAIPKRKKKLLERESRKIKLETPSNDLSSRGLTLEETVDTLENYEEHLSYCRAVRPKGGEIYVFDRNRIGDDWKCDGYIWRNSGTRYMPSKNPVLRKNFYFIRTAASGDRGSREFRRTACHLLERPNIVLVHYMGDETVFTPRPHGNRKKGNIEFQRTCPSVIEAIKSCVVDESPVETYNRLLTAGGEKPRDIKQIQSLKERLTRSTRQPRKKRKCMSAQEAQHTVEFDPNTMTVELYDPSNDSMNNSEVTDANTVTDENIQPLLMEPLDSHPEIRKAQLQILQQQRRNMKLQEEKLKLEIEKLERNKRLTHENQTETVPGLQVVQYVDEASAGDVTELDEQNVIYVNSESELINLTEGVYDGGEPQYVYIQEGSVDDGVHYVSQM